MLSRVIQLNNKQITIQQDLSLSHAGTVWDGALVLIYFLQKNPQLTKKYITNQTILQLGSGTGVLGFSLLVYQPKSLYLTDLPDYLTILQRNLQQNKQLCKQTKTLLQIKPLKWAQLSHMQSLPKLNTIIGSQLAYDDTNMTDLLSTFLYFFNLNPNLTIIISYQKYSNPKRNLYIRLHQLNQFNIEEVDKQLMNQQYQDQNIGILIITKK